MLSPEFLGKDLSLPLLASGVCWQSLGSLCLLLPHSNLCLCCHMAVLFLGVSLLLLRTLVMLDLVPILLQYDLI